ncbi:hypothetical protein COOONC_21125 [Cooperia oncophora]
MFRKTTTKHSEYAIVNVALLTQVLFRFGSLISAVGCACNLLLLFLFLMKSFSNPAQTFLAFLDFMLCFLFIACFGALSLSVTFRIEWLYTLIKNNNVYMLIVSRIVQLCIPYTLIANTAFRLASINQRSRPVKQSGNLRITVFIIATTAVLLRLPGYFFIEVVELPHCDFFESRVLSGKVMDPLVAKMYTISDVIIQFLHLFVSFIILCVLNCIVVRKMRTTYDRARSQSLCPDSYMVSFVYGHFKSERGITQGASKCSKVPLV